MASYAITATHTGVATQTLSGFGGFADLPFTPHDSDSTMWTVFDWPNTENPTTKREEYRLVVVDSGGSSYAELTNAVINNVTWAVSEFGGVDFDMPLDDPKVDECLLPQREVQVWRGTQLIQWCVLVRARSDDQKVSFQGVTLEWYLGRRIMGPVPKVGHFKQAGFETGVGGWNYSFMPGSRTKTAPSVSASNDVKLMGDGSLMMSPSSGTTKDIRLCENLFTSTTSTTLSSGGASAIASITNATFGDNPQMTVVVYHDSTLSASAAQALTDARADVISDAIHNTKPEALVKAYGRGERQPRATNTTSAGRSQNRRAVFTYKNDDGKKGHGEYAAQSFDFRVPAGQKVPTKVTFRGWVYIEDFNGPAMNNWGLVLERQHASSLSKNPKYAARGFHRVLARAAVPITKATPVGRWIRMEANLNVPNDGHYYRLVGRIFSPAGTAYWDEVNLFTDDGLRYADVDESVIINGLVDHAQDVSMGKTTLNFKKSIKKTGIKRTRTYLFSEREVIYDLLHEFPTLMNGSEWDIQVTPEARTFTTYYPRKGFDKDYPLTLGQNIASFDVDTDAEQTANQVVIMAYEAEGMAREERMVSDKTLLGGLILEKAYESTPGASMATLYGQAVRGIERYRKPVIIPNLVSNPKHLSDILAHVTVGDRVPVDVRKGWMQAYGMYRIVTMSLDPNTDQITFTVLQEDQKITTLVGWRSTGWKYKAQSQIGKTGDNNRLPKETDVAYAARDFDDSSWSVGQAPFGWNHDGTQYTGSSETVITTTLPQKYEVWMRRSVRCTEEMYLWTSNDFFTYLYVNGHRIDYRPDVPYISSDDFGNKNPRGAYRVPSAFLDPSGVQVVAMHVQDRLSDYGGAKPDAMTADMYVSGIYNPDHVKAP